MNFRPLLLGLPALLASCWYQTSSTDVDNEIKVSMTGTVVTGQVSSSPQALTIINAKGDSIASLSTDSLGNFTWNSSLKNSDLNGLARVHTAQGLTAVLPNPDPQGHIHLLIHPLNDYAYRNITGVTTFAAFQAKADSLLGRIVGPGFHYLNDGNPGLFAPINGSAHPSPLAILITQLQATSLQNNASISQLLDSANHQQPILLNNNFLVGIIGQGNLSGCDSTAMHNQLNLWLGGNAGSDLDEAVNNLPPPPPMDSLNSNAKQIAGAGLNSLQARLFGPPPIDNRVGPPADSTGSADIRTIMPNIQGLVINISYSIQSLLTNPDNMQRSQFFTLNLGNLLGNCVLEVQDSSRHSHPDLVGQVCDSIASQQIQSTTLNNWIQNADSTGIKAIINLNVMQTLKQNLGLQLSKQGLDSLLFLK